MFEKGKLYKILESVHASRDAFYGPGHSKDLHKGDIILILEPPTKQNTPRKTFWVFKFLAPDNRPYYGRYVYGNSQYSREQRKLLRESFEELKT